MNEEELARGLRALVEEIVHDHPAAASVLYTLCACIGLRTTNDMVAHLAPFNAGQLEMMRQERKTVETMTQLFSSEEE